MAEVVAETRRPVHRLSRERRVATIMAAARAVFEERGYEEALISEIAERAGVVEGTIYRYFDHKRDLMIKVIEAWYSGMLAEYDAGLRPISGTRNRLRFMIFSHLKTIHDDPALCRLTFQVLRTGADYTTTNVYTLNREYTRRTVAIIREGITAGELRDDLPLRLARDMVYGSIEHRTWAYLRGEGDFDPAATADAIAELVYRGLRRDTEAPAGLAERLEHVADRLDGKPPSALQSG